MEDSLSHMLSRKCALEKSLSRLEKRLQQEQEEYKKICTAFDVMHNYGIDIDGKDTSTRPQTIGDMVLAILTEYAPLGISAADILSEIHKRWMPDLVRSSLSPPLSRLKERGEVILEDGAWKLTDKNKGSDTSISEPLKDKPLTDMDVEIPF